MHWQELLFGSTSEPLGQPCLLFSNIGSSRAVKLGCLTIAQYHEPWIYYIYIFFHMFSVFIYLYVFFSQDWYIYIYSIYSHVAIYHPKFLPTLGTWVFGQSLSAAAGHASSGVPYTTGNSYCIHPRCPSGQTSHVFFFGGKLGFLSILSNEHEVCFHLQLQVPMKFQAFLEHFW